MNILKESIDELAAKNSGLYTDVIMFLLVYTFFFFLMCLQKVKLVPYMLREGEERTVLLTILYCFIAAEDLVCNA